MSILVSDTSIIIDLERGEVLEVLFQLPFEFAVPDLLFNQELAEPEGDRLRALGLRVEELDGAEVAIAASLARKDGALSGPDTFAYALARGRGWTLLTGDQRLRQHAEADSIDVHGTLWILDAMEGEGVLDATALHVCLSKLSSHPRCRLPKPDVSRRLARWARNSA